MDGMRAGFFLRTRCLDFAEDLLAEVAADRRTSLFLRLALAFCITLVM